MHAIAYYPGSCGEIIQGRVKEQDLLISCPVNLYTRVKIFETKAPIVRNKYYKAWRLLNNLADKWNITKELENIDIEISSQIPMGKGFASSTADLCAAYYAAAKLFGKEADIQELARECLMIEPTDSIIFNSLTLFDYKNGNYYKSLGEYIEFYLLVFEGTKIVDTVAFNNSNIPNLDSIEDILNLMEGRRIQEIAKASTISILRNQRRLEYEVIDEILRIKEETGGLGIMGGHSGDVLAIVFDDEDKLKRALNKQFQVEGYTIYPLKTLRSVVYEDNYDCSTIQWKW